MIVEKWYPPPLAFWFTSQDPWVTAVTAYSECVRNVADTIDCCQYGLVKVGALRIETVADAGGIHNKCCYMADKVTTTADISSKRGNETFRYIGDHGEDFLQIFCDLAGRHIF